MTQNTGSTSSANPKELLSEGLSGDVATKTSAQNPQFRNLLENLRQNFPQTEGLPLAKDEANPGEKLNPFAKALQSSEIPTLSHEQKIKEQDALELAATQRQILEIAESMKNDLDTNLDQTVTKTKVQPAEATIGEISFLKKMVRTLLEFSEQNKPLNNNVWNKAKTEYNQTKHTHNMLENPESNLQTAGQ